MKTYIGVTDFDWFQKIGKKSKIEIGDRHRKGDRHPNRWLERLNPAPAK